jgi:hypothetical protein
VRDLSVTRIDSHDVTLWPNNICDLGGYCADTAADIGDAHTSSEPRF